MLINDEYTTHRVCKVFIHSMDMHMETLEEWGQHETKSKW